MTSAIAEHDADKNRIGKIHRNYAGPISAKRNRQRLKTACGFFLLKAFPVSDEDFVIDQSCRHCYPDTESDNFDRIANIAYDAMPWEGETYQAVAERIAADLVAAGWRPTRGVDGREGR